MMKSKAILVSFMALFAVVFALSAVSAMVTVNDVFVNDVSVATYTSVGQVGDVVPVEVQFTANTDLEERVRVKVYIEGYKSDIVDSTVMRTPLEAGVTYVERFSLTLPSTMDLDDFSEDLRFTGTVDSGSVQDFVRKSDIILTH